MASPTLIPESPQNEKLTTPFDFSAWLQDIRIRIRQKWNRYYEQHYLPWAAARRESLYYAGLLPFQKIKRDPNFPCPACGARNGEIRWVGNVTWKSGAGASVQGALIHQCKVCTAAWPQMPIVNSREWDIQVPAESLPNRPQSLSEIVKNA